MDALATATVSLAPRPLRVVERRAETEDVVTLALDTGPSGFAYRPGQFVMLSRFGVGEVPISIAGGGGGDGADRLLLTIRAVGAVTERLVAAEPGTVLGVRGPFGTSWPLPGAGRPDALFMAGGLGLAPLRAAIRATLAAPERFRRVTVLHGAREPAAIAFRDEIDAWARKPHADVRLTVDVADPGWRGEVGLITALLEDVDVDPAATHAFVCGPEVMMRFSARMLAERGVPAERIALSVERNMECGVGLCGRCQLGPFILCRDGPVLSWDRLARPLAVEEL